MYANLFCRYASTLLAYVLFFTMGIVGGHLNAQPYCENSDELLILQSTFDDPEQVRQIMENRYGSHVIDRPSFSTYANLIPGLNQTFLDPNFGFPIKLVATSINQINGERNAWNADGSLAFFRTHTYKLSIFDGEKGDFIREVEFSARDFSGTSTCMAYIYWHPTDPNLLVYFKGAEIRTRHIFTGADNRLVRFNHGTIGINGTKMAGGDGNDISQIAHRYLLTMGSKTENALVYDFEENAVARTRLMGSPGNYYHGVEYVPITAGGNEPTFNLPADIDYATTSYSGEYLVVLDDGKGTMLYDLNGQEIGLLYENTPHTDVIQYHHQGKIYEGVMCKMIGARAQLYGMVPGDMAAICWEVITDRQTGKRELVRHVFQVMDWLDEGVAGGGQHSFNGLAGGKTLLAMNPSAAVGARGWGSYYDEIVEVSLDSDDPTPRRLLHHMVTRTSPVMKQPEVWASPDGSKLFFKSHVNDQLPNEAEYLFFVEIGPRTCKDARDAYFDTGAISDPDPDPDPDPNPNPGVTCDLPQGWLNSDIGPVTIAGEACEDSGMYNIKASGWDIWRDEDAFHYTYQVLSGDGELIARVNSLDYTDEYAKAGVMIRENLTAGSANALMYLAPNGRWSFQRRVDKGTNTYSTKSDAGAVTFPHWVRIVRSGNAVTGYHSSDGINWFLTDTDFIPMSNDVYIGLAVTSHNETVATNASFDAVAFGTQGFTFPVEFAAFTAEAEPEFARVRLDWVTASEQNNSYFSIERSRDGLLFEAIDEVASQGNSQQNQRYEAFDNDPVQGRAFYRLKQVDLDGTFTYSDKVEVTFDRLSTGWIKAYPVPIQLGNPLQVEFSLPTSSTAHVMLMSASGQVLWQDAALEVNPAGARFSLPIDNLSPGMYLLQVRGHEGQEAPLARQIVVLP